MLIECNCFVYKKSNNKQAELYEELGIDTPDEELIPIPFAFKITEISSVRPEIDEDGSISINSIIYMKSGESFVIDYSYRDLIKIIKGI